MYYTCDVYIQSADKNSWVMLDAPPDIDPQSGEKTYEEQQVKIKFRLKDAIPDTSQKFVIVKRNNKYEMEYVGGGGGGGSQVNDPEFKLKPVDTKSSSATTRVSIQLDSKPIYVAPKGTKSSHAVPIYDSSQIPDVNMR